MKKPYTKQRPFSKPFSAGDSSTLPLEALDRVSVFETLRAYGGRVFCADEHLARFEGSCRAIGRALPSDAAEIRRWLAASLRERGLKDALLRLSAHWDAAGGGRWQLFLREFKSHPHAWYQKGVALKTAVCRRFDFKAQDPQIKTSQFMNGVLALLDEQSPAAHELVFFGPRGTVAEGSVSNIFIAREKRLLTPAGPSGILKGVTRSVVIALAKKRRIPVVETLLTRHELYTAEECFLTNTSSEVLPVASMDGRRIGLKVPGPVTQALMREFKKETK